MSSFKDCGAANKHSKDITRPECKISQLSYIFKDKREELYKRQLIFNGTIVYPLQMEGPQYLNSLTIDLHISLNTIKSA
jgi:hypothetical protein